MPHFMGFNISWPTDPTQSLCQQNNLCHSKEKQQPQMQLRITHPFIVLQGISHNLLFIIFQLNCYTNLHWFHHISSHRHNQEPLLPMPPLPQQREAASARAGKNSTYFHFYKPFCKTNF
jgi:hypothetical protein